MQSEAEPGEGSGMMDRAKIGWMIGLATAIGLALGCATDLKPAPEAREVVAGPGLGAAEEVAGIRTEARVQAWGWSPRRLDRELTPVLVKIRNQSERPLRVRYSDFVLEDPEGQRYAALPPYDIDAKVSERIRPAYAYSSFHVAPHIGHYYSPYYFGHHHPGAFGHYRPYFGTHYSSLQRVQLPTNDMLARALPEGVIDPDGNVAGFLYFEEVEEPAQGRVMFRFSLVEADTKEQFGEIEIPFQLE